MLFRSDPPREPERPQGKAQLRNAEDIGTLVQTFTDAVTKDNKTIQVHWWVE